MIQRLLGHLVPESPARTAGEQLRLTIQWRKQLRDLPTTPEPAPKRED
jgi:hypothetical protein